jgi:carbamoyltransferase
LAAILGLNAYHGDAAAALVVDGRLVAAAEEERFSPCVAGFRRWRRPGYLAEGPLVSRCGRDRLPRAVGHRPAPELGFDCEWRCVEPRRHLASAFFPSGFEDAAVLSADAFGDGVSTMLGREGSSLEVLERVAFRTRSACSTPPSRSGSASLATATRE